MKIAHWDIMNQDDHKLPAFDAVIFDFDGVVVDSTNLHIQCWEIAHMQMFGKVLPDPQSLLGAGGRHIARKLASDQKKQPQWEDLYELKTRLLQEQEDLKKGFEAKKEGVLAVRAAKNIVKGD